MPVLKKDVHELLHAGTVIPAHPLVLDASRQLDEQKQRRLTRYYMSAGAGGVAVGVHTTQFEIRKPEYNLYNTVLKLAAEEVDRAGLKRPFIKVAGIVGPTEQALKEADIAVGYGYDLGLVSLGGLQNYSDADLIRHVRAVAERIPVFGFYLQPAVGGRILNYHFWKQFVEIENVQAIKVAAFNRYQTLDVVRAVCASSRKDEVALYTGNDDNIVADLLTPYVFNIDGVEKRKSFVGGLLGHWAVWTNKAVHLLKEIKTLQSLNAVNSANGASYLNLLSRGIEITDMNEVIFDARNSFHGCIPGIHEVLRRQGLMDGRWCLRPDEDLSVGQAMEIDRINKMYPHQTDDEFVAAFLRNEK